MRKIWKMLGIGVVLLALITTASAHWWWESEDSEKITQEAEELLKNAELEEYHSYRFYTVHYRIISEGRYVGVLWEDVSLDEVVAGEPHLMMWGARVPLLYNGEVVGWLFVESTEDWYHPGYHGCWNYNTGPGYRGHMGMVGWR